MNLKPKQAKFKRILSQIMRLKVAHNNAFARTSWIKEEEGTQRRSSRMVSHLGFEGHEVLQPRVKEEMGGTDNHLRLNPEKETNVVEVTVPQRSKKEKPLSLRKPAAALPQSKQTVSTFSRHNCFCVDVLSDKFWRHSFQFSSGFAIVTAGHLITSSSPMMFALSTME